MRTIRRHRTTGLPGSRPRRASARSLAALVTAVCALSVGAVGPARAGGPDCGGVPAHAADNIKSCGGTPSGNAQTDKDGPNKAGPSKDRSGPTSKPVPVTSSKPRGGPAPARTQASDHEEPASARPRARRARKPSSFAGSRAGGSAPAATMSLTIKRFPVDPAPGPAGYLATRDATRTSAGWEPVTPGPDALELAASAVDAARTLAFPLSLTLAVAAFLLLQGRIDRRDPKLAVWRREMAHFE